MTRTKQHGKYYHSLREWLNAGGSIDILKAPNIHRTGSVKGMRRDFWGTSCDVVRIGNWIYKAN